MRDHSLVLAWDVDDVLNSLTAEWAHHHKLEFSGERRNTCEPVEYFSRQGLDRESLLASLDAFRQSNYGSLLPNQTALDVIILASQSGYIQVAITRTPFAFRSVVAEWVFDHFGEWFQGVCVVPSPRATDPAGFRYREKGELLAVFRQPTVLVDDAKANLSSLPNDSRGVLYPQPWNDAPALASPQDLYSRIGAATPSPRSLNLGVS